MTNKKDVKGTLFVSIITLLLCFIMLLGVTTAWFTDYTSNANNVIQSGNLDVELWHSTYKDSASSSEWGVGFGYSDAKGSKVDESTKLFLNENNNPILWEPGACAVENFRIKNEGSLALKYKFRIKAIDKTTTEDGKSLADVLSLYIDEINWQDNGVPTGTTVVDGQKFGEGYTFEGELLAGEYYDFWVGLEWLPSENDNDYNVAGGLSILLGIELVATQLRYESDGVSGSGFDKEATYPNIADKWDGTADISWYTQNPDAERFYISSAEQLAGLAKLVDGISTNELNEALGIATITDENALTSINFADKEIKLTGNVDLYAEGNEEPISFNPIGDNSAFEGIFDGNGFTISNLYQSGWVFGYEWGSYGSIGLFGELKNATVKNVTIKGAECYVEGGDVSFIAGSATGTCVFENITIEDSVIATYNNGCGGIIGWSGEGNYTFKDITIKEDVVLGGLWGSFDSSIGGIVGQGEPGATYNFENVNIACRIDAYNDCTASYDYYNYRMCGMIIGRLEETTTINGANYPDTSKYYINCKNVTVTYGDWANYHYCRAEGARAIRVEAGYAYDGIAGDYDHSVCTTHHMELIPFDQIFGGDQYAVKGLKAYDGVTVVYNNK